MEEGFFKAIADKYRLFRWQDFFGPHGKFKDVKVPRKLEGMVEMAICAGGRIFFGTRDSTFSSYITRLRGYFNAPDQHSLLHNSVYSGNIEEDGKKIGVLWGSRYMVEFPEMWESIRDM